MKTLPVLSAVLFLAGTPCFAQDFQVGSRAKGMGGSYSAFDEDPVSIWMNPAAIAHTPSRFAIDYQTFTQYEVKDSGTNLGTVGTPKTGLLDPSIIPSFLGFTSPIAETGSFSFEFGLALVRPFQNRLTYVNAGVVEQTEQQFSRYRIAFAGEWTNEGNVGLLHSVALGLGGDVATSVYSEEDNAGALSRTDHETALGYGAGIFIGLFTNKNDWTLDFGVAYQSQVKFNWALDTEFFPVWNWPTMVSTGLTLKMLDRGDWRITADVQRIFWGEATGNDQTGAGEDFRNSTNLSFGTEYVIRTSSTVYLVPRAGYRLYEAPWKDKSLLPAIGQNVLSIKTKGGRFSIITFGGTLQWLSDEKVNKIRSFDLGVEVGGDKPNFAFGYHHDF